MLIALLHHSSYPGTGCTPCSGPLSSSLICLTRHFESDEKSLLALPCSSDSPRHPAFAQCSGRRLLSLSLEGWRANSQFREFRVNEENILILQPLTPEFIRTLRGSLKGKPSALKILQKERKCNVRAA